jgi:hypothetical protein
MIFFHLSTLPRFETRHSAIALHPVSPIIFIALHNNSFWLYDITLRRITDWSSKFSEAIPQKLRKQSDRILGIAFDPASDNFSSVVLWGHSFLFHIDFKALLLFITLFLRLECNSDVCRNNIGPTMIKSIQLLIATSLILQSL